MVKVQKLSNVFLRWLMLPLLLVIGTSGFAAAHSGVFRADGGLIADDPAGQIRYQLNPLDPTTFESVSFTLRGPADQVYVGLGNGIESVEWVPCSLGSQAEYQCDLRPLSLSLSEAVEIQISTSY